MLEASRSAGRICPFLPCRFAAEGARRSIRDQLSRVGEEHVRGFVACVCGTLAHLVCPGYLARRAAPSGSGSLPPRRQP